MTPTPKAKAKIHFLFHLIHLASTTRDGLESIVLILSPPHRKQRAAVRDPRRVLYLYSCCCLVGGGQVGAIFFDFAETEDVHNSLSRDGSYLMYSMEKDALFSLDASLLLEFYW